MRSMKIQKHFLETLKGNVGKRPPFWIMRQAGRYLPEYRKVRENTGGFLDMCFTPDKAAEVTLQPLRRFDMDAAIIFSDILVIPYALDIPVTFVKGEGPKLEPSNSPDALKKIQLKDVVANLKPVYEAIEQVRAELSPEKALIGFCGAPWTVATYIIEGGSSRDFTTTRQLALQAPEAFSHLMDVLVESSALHLVAQVKAGADVVQIFDSWAGVVPNEEFNNWCIEPVKKLITRVKTLCPETPVIAFPKGIGFRYSNYAELTGADAVGVDMTVPLANMVGLEKQSAVQGNLDPLVLAYNKELALKKAREMLTSMQGKRYIFNLGHGIIPQTPIENVEALCTLIREWK